MPKLSGEKTGHRSQKTKNGMRNIGGGSTWVIKLEVLGHNTLDPEKAELAIGVRVIRQKHHFTRRGKRKPHRLHPSSQGVPGFSKTVRVTKDK